MSSIPSMIILNARLLTMTTRSSPADAIAIKDNKIIQLGKSSDIRQMATAQTRIIDAAGRTVMPGFIDSHVHLFQGAAELEFLSVGGYNHLDDIDQKIKNYAHERPDEPIILGVGAFYSLFERSDKSPRALLDDIIANRPLALLGADLHTVWANTCALKAAGIINGAPVPEGSTIIMGNDGRATGTLLETGAFGPILSLSRTGGRDMLGYVTGDDPNPPATQMERHNDKELLKKGLDHVAAQGITTLHNMDGNFYQLELLSELETENQLKARVQVPFHLKNFDPIDRLDEAKEMHQHYQSDMVWSGRIKMFIDGVIESKTALKINGYPDDPNNHGEAIFESHHFNEACIYADKLGLQISVHAVGDLAVKRVLDGYEAAQNANGSRDARHRIEHIELIDLSDLDRMKNLGVVASMQPLHAAFGGFFDPPAPNTLFFKEECGRAFPWEMIRQKGIPLAFSTDWPVVPLSALSNIKCAVAPLDLGPEWAPQKQTLMNALNSYTRINAWMGFQENFTGTLERGMAADIVILSDDITQYPINQIDDLNIAMTICDGNITYEKGLL